MTEFGQLPSLEDSRAALVYESQAEVARLHLVNARFRTALEIIDRLAMVSGNGDAIRKVVASALEGAEERETYLTVAQAAKLLYTSPESVRRWCREGKIPTVQMGRKHMIPARFVTSRMPVYDVDRAGGETDG